MDCFCLFFEPSKIKWIHYYVQLIYMINWNEFHSRELNYNFLKSKSNQTQKKQLNNFIHFWDKRLQNS